MRQALAMVVLGVAACTSSVGGKPAVGGAAGKAATGGAGAAATGGAGAAATGGATSSGGTTGSGSGGAGGTTTVVSSGGSTAGSGGGNGSGGVGQAGATASGGGPGSGGASGLGGGAGGLGGAVFAPPALARTDTTIADGWKFLRSEASGANAPSFNDTTWAAVTLPHTWNAADGQDGGSYYRGIGWYRLHYTPPASAAGKRMFLQFDGAATAATVYVNGTMVGQHRGGFARFRFDVTGTMMPGSDNLIAVQVSNAEAPDLPPLAGDFTQFGGLYRDVHLVVTDTVHVDQLDYGAPGVYVDTPTVSATAATVRARVRVRNDSASAQLVTVDSVVVGADGKVAVTLTATAMVPGGTTQLLTAMGSLMSPHLWDGVAAPYLYKVYAEVRVGTTVTDWVAVPLGVRTFKIDPAQGVSLNGRVVDLHGVNRHQDRIDAGWAITQAQQDEDMGLLRELGATAVRLAHYQHADYFYDSCDRAGIAVWTELGNVNSVSTTTAFTASATQQLTELIRQQFNHPSIIVWGLGNELANSPDPNSLLGTLNDLAHAEDPSRLTTYAANLGDNDPSNWHGDTVGFNKYYGWYYGTPPDLGTWADGIHRAYPTARIGISEYGAGASITTHSDMSPVVPVAAGQHYEEYQALLHETSWPQLASRPFLWGKFIWCMFDFASDGRNEGDTAGRNDKGLVTYDRKTKKDAFFFYKANWTAAPFVYITSRRSNPRTTPITVKVYSNMDTVRLQVNGSVIGTSTATNHIFQWKNVVLVPGANTVVATGTSGTSTATDTVTWMGM